jgi:hypothetical protein
VVKVAEVDVRLVGVPSVEVMAISPPPAVKFKGCAPLIAPRVISLFPLEPVSVIVPPPAFSTTLLAIDTPAPAVFTVRVPLRVTVASLYV